ncbi:hypothetical protein DTO271G3_1516 [Paecilomyces variotii]|nr:hypothetical protein DTO271G3_1516 [Paecilomyces variotii]
MTTVVAPATAAPLTAHHVDRDQSPKNYPALAPSMSTAASVSTPSRMSTASQDGSAKKSSPSDRKRSPQSAQSGANAPKIVVKKEPPSSPSLQTNSRHRPRKLDLSASLPASSGLSARAPGGPMTAREPMGIQEVGIACLSPGFQTHDPAMREQLQRSISVRDQQRSIIESRLQKTAKGDGPDGVKPSESNLFGSGPKSSKKRPPGLSIVAPPASQFAHERVIQSAPLNQTFTGRHQPQTLTRHVSHQIPSLSSSHIHHAPANQTNNRLPPISDVFGSDALGPRDRHHPSGSTPSQSNGLPRLPSPSQMPKRPREYRSAEEAVHELAGGREELLPRIVHYGGHQPPTPPSPLVHTGSRDAQHASVAAPSSERVNSISSASHGTSRRRPRSEYEQDNGSPPLGNGPDTRYKNGPATGGPPPSAYYGPFGAGRDSPETQRRKKEEFLSLCSRAWDLFHS